MKRWTQRIFVVAIVAAGIGLVWLQKRDIMINDAGWSIDYPQEWTLKCRDGTRGTFIGDKAIQIEGCEITATHRVLPVR